MNWPVYAEMIGTESKHRDIRQWCRLNLGHGSRSRREPSMGYRVFWYAVLQKISLQKVSYFTFNEMTVYRYYFQNEEAKTFFLLSWS